MNKKISILLLISAILIALSSISFQAQTKNIRVWVGAISEEKEAMEQIGANFKAETGIGVEVIQKLEIFTVPTALANNAELSDRPDIVYLQAPDIGGLIKSGFLEPIEFDESYEVRFNQVAFEAFQFEGKTYGLGYSNSTSGLIYNKDIISKEELPETWDDFFELAKTLTIKDNNNNITRRGACFNITDMWFNYPIIRHFGGYYYGQISGGTYNPYDIGLNSSGMLNYVDQMKEMQEYGLAINNKEQKDYSLIVSDFSEGKVAMFLYGLWSASVFKNKGINYGIAELPYSGEERSRPLTTVEGFVINKFTRDLDSTKLFYEYLFKDENQQLLIEAGNRYNLKTGERTPCNLAVLNSNYIQEDEILKSISEIGKHVEPFPNIPEGTLWYNQNVTQVTLGNIFFGDNYGNKVDAKVKLDELVDFLNEEVMRMNDVVAEAKYDSWVYILILSIALAIVLVGYFLYQRKKMKAPNYLKPINDKKETIIGYLLLIPFIILIALFYIYPILHNFHLSTTNYSGINLRNYSFIGFANYKTIFTAELGGLVEMSLWTLVFAFSVSVLSFVFGTLLATVLESTNSKIAKIYRVIYILPWVIPTVITLLVWRGLLATEGGLINQMLNFIGIRNVPWLTSKYLARVSTIFVMVWFSFPYYMVIAFGFLKSISKDYYEAAIMDGASKAQMFLKITLPLTFRALVPMLIMGFIMQFNQFGVYLLTEGGPASNKIGAPGATDLLVTYVFNTSFNTKRYGLAASYSVVIFVFMAVFAIVSMAINRRKERR